MLLAVPVNGGRYYRWIVPDADGPDTETLYISDWYSCNVNQPELEHIFIDRGHGHINLPGLVTWLLQVNDVILHFVLSRKYKRREVLSAMQQLQMGVTLPTSTAQEVNTTSTTVAFEYWYSSTRASRGITQARGIPRGIAGPKMWHYSTE